MGQFLSWAMAKSAQTNKILARMENGNAKTLVKTLAVLPIYSGVQSLREIAKYGEVITDYDANNNRWWSEGARLSGMFGYLPELVANRFIGPGSREPWFLFPPAAQVASAPVEAGQAAWNGNTDRAIRILSERLAPFPNWRRTFARLFLSPNRSITTSGSGTIGNEIMFSTGGIVKRKKFKHGGTHDVVEQAAKEVILPIAKPEKTDENSLPVMELNNTIPETVKTRIKINENDKLFKDDTSEIVHDSVEKGNKTIGYGHKLTDDEVKSGEVYGYKISTLTKEQAEDIFNRDLEVARGDVDSLIDKDTTDPKAYGVLIEMAHQIGGTKLPKFKKMLEAVNRKDYKEAAKQMLFNYDDEGNKIGKTNWNKQTGNRAKSLAALMSSITFDRIEKNIGGIVGKAIAKGLSKAAVKRGDTAISTTVGTYKKVNKIFDDANVKTVHDFGSGLGLGSKEFTNKIVTNHEPFVPVEKIIKVKGKVPDYKTADDVIFKEGFASKDGVVNANVLNVIEDPMERSNVVRQISQLISDKGMAVITTRGSEVTKAAQTSKNATPFNDGWIFGKGDKKTFQKGYSQKELEEYIKSILGDKFKVEKIPSKYKIGTSGVIIKKIKGDK